MALSSYKSTCSCPPGPFIIIFRCVAAYCDTGTTEHCISLQQHSCPSPLSFPAGHIGSRKSCRYVTSLKWPYHDFGSMVSMFCHHMHSCISCMLCIYRETRGDRTSCMCCCTKAGHLTVSSVAGHRYNSATGRQSTSKWSIWFHVCTQQVEAVRAWLSHCNCSS